MKGKRILRQKNPIAMEGVNNDETATAFQVLTLMYNTVKTFFA